MLLNWYDIVDFDSGTVRLMKAVTVPTTMKRCARPWLLWAPNRTTSSRYPPGPTSKMNRPAIQSDSPRLSIVSCIQLKNQTFEKKIYLKTHNFKTKIWTKTALSKTAPTAMLILMIIFHWFSSITRNTCS